jgi:hypothetical protein
MNLTPLGWPSNSTIRSGLVWAFRVTQCLVEEESYLFQQILSWTGRPPRASSQLPPLFYPSWPIYFPEYSKTNNDVVGLMIKLSSAQVNSWRLSKNHLAQRAPKRDMPRVVSDVCGLQAQVLSGAAPSLWARVENITIEDVEDALWSHWTLVKTWAMRGTLHLLSSNCLSTYVAALKTRHELHGEKISYRIGPGSEDKKYEITRAEQERITKAIDNALDQHTLTREELAREIVKRTKLRPILQSHLLSGFGSLLQQAAHQGSLIFGPSQGAKVTFTRPDQWLGRQDQPSGEQALKTLLRQFYSTLRPVHLRRLCPLVGGPGARCQTSGTTHRQGTGTGRV